ncbi:MAG: hypothetical protein LBD06_10410 [Candidatus Accumulibacter sp.]|jgi:hypothetical protein|nr:hypothetical protein [Accumulibacter sp.]
MLPVFTTKALLAFRFREGRNPETFVSSFRIAAEKRKWPLMKHISFQSGWHGFPNEALLHKTMAWRRRAGACPVASLLPDRQFYWRSGA